MTDAEDPLERALAHADLGLPVPRGTRFRFVKRLLARAARLFTTHQVEVNRALAESVLGLRTALSQAEARATATTDELANDLAALRTELSDVQVGILEGRSDVALLGGEPAGAQDGIPSLGDRVERMSALPGVNVIGDFAAMTGLIEAGRRLVQAAVSSGIDVEVTDVDLPLPKSPAPTRRQLDGLSRGRSHDIEVWCVNVNELRHIDESTLRPPGERPRYVIAVWFWEALSLPHWARTEVARVDEIWVPSRFVRQAFQTVTSKPVVVVPCVVDEALPGRPQRSDFDLPTDAMLFFFNFDASSSDGRKNPWGVIQAFERAFTDDERSGPARLVIKTQNLDAHPRLRAELERQMKRIDGILVDGELPRDRMTGLIGCVDVYVSLHRGEGFGLGIAEAMLLGKPVIVTAYSGNMDYTTRTNSCLVGYTLRPIDESDHRLTPHGREVYEPGLTWAEPNVGQAARWMRYLYDHPEERVRIGRAGAMTVKEQLNPRAVGNVIANRLAEISDEISVS